MHIGESLQFYYNSILPIYVYAMSKGIGVKIKIHRALELARVPTAPPAVNPLRPTMAAMMTARP